MDLTHSKMRDALGVSATSLENWLRNAPRRRTGAGRANDPYVYDLAGVVPALRSNRAKGLSGGDLRALCDLVHDQSPDTVLADADARAKALTDVLTPAEIERFNRVRKWAGQGAVYGIWDRIHTVDLPRALALLILRPVALRYVLTSEKSDQFPTTRDGWSDFTMRHIASTATPNEIEHERDPECRMKINN